MAKKKDLKLMVVMLYRDEDVAVTLVDEGQDFPELFKAFNKQDNPRNEDCLGFTDFMKANKVEVVENVKLDCLEYYS